MVSWCVNSPCHTSSKMRDQFHAYCTDETLWGADMCGCDVEDLLEGEYEKEGDVLDESEIEALRAQFWSNLWNGVIGLPLKDGIKVSVLGTDPGEALDNLAGL